MITKVFVNYQISLKKHICRTQFIYYYYKDAPAIFNNNKTSF